MEKEIYTHRANFNHVNLHEFSLIYIKFNNNLSSHLRFLSPDVCFSFLIGEGW